MEKNKTITKQKSSNNKTITCENRKRDNHSVYTTIGASNHTDNKRAEYDFYVTDPKALQELLKHEKFNSFVWEPACGLCHLSKVLAENGYIVWSSDIVDRCGNATFDFLGENLIDWHGDIITNPPYNLAAEFVERAIECIDEGNRVCMLLRIQFLEEKKNKELFDKYPPKYIYVSSRINCMRNGEEQHQTSTFSTVRFGWYIWEKGFKGEPTIRWFN